MNLTSRRNFLRTTALGGVGMAALAGLRPTALLLPIRWRFSSAG